MPEHSTLSFSAVQNGAPVKGEFSTFGGDIIFSPDDLAHSRVAITIDMHSVSTLYEDIANTLLGADWFSVVAFPQASFVADHFEKTEAGYRADGKLTIRNQTHPCQVSFTFEEDSQKHAHVNGKAIVKRAQFGVGQGEWADIGVIKDEVLVEFTILVSSNDT
jgi:polyisoprenoid-binding protein YceI